MSKALKWETIDVEQGQLERARLRSNMKAYVRGDGTWVVMQRIQYGWQALWSSDHRTRGTSMVLGKIAIANFLNTYCRF